MFDAADAAAGWAVLTDGFWCWLMIGLAMYWIGWCISAGGRFIRELWERS